MRHDQITPAHIPCSILSLLTPEDPRIRRLQRWSCRDGAMRTELESRLVFAAPSELLVAAPVSAASQRLLGAYTAQVSQQPPRSFLKLGKALRGRPGAEDWY